MACAGQDEVVMDQLEVNLRGAPKGSGGSLLLRSVLPLETAFNVP